MNLKNCSHKDTYHIFLSVLSYAIIVIYIGIHLLKGFIGVFEHI